MENKIPDFLKYMLKEQYGEQLSNKIIDGYTYKRPVTLRTNNIKTDKDTIEKKLNALQIKFSKVKWSDDSFIINNKTEKDIKLLSMYINGEIYLQSLSSMIPALVLAPQKEEDILDMAAAPGGKTTQTAAITKNKSNITACEINKIRAERLKYNINKQGATSTYVMEKDAREINNFFSFDKILLDAPCSGSGTLNINDKNIEKYFTKKLIDKSIKTQISLLRKAINILKKGQTMVYSTCSILSCENEEIIENILKENRAEIVPVEFQNIEELPLLPVKIKGTLCICPTDLYEGFFVAKLRRI